MPESNPFIEARDSLASAITTLPVGYLNENAAALLSVIEELKKSCHVEFRLIQAIRGLDVKDGKAVERIAKYLIDYDEISDFDRERTHCHNIDRIVSELLKPYQTDWSEDRTKIEAVEKLLKPLCEADNAYLEQIEPLVRDAAETMRRIKNHVSPGGGGEAAAERERDDFLLKAGDRVERVKLYLRSMNKLANTLLDAI